MEIVEITPSKGNAGVWSQVVDRQRTRNRVSFINLRVICSHFHRNPVSEPLREVSGVPTVKEPHPERWRSYTSSLSLINLENVDLETISLSSNPKFIQLIERVRSRRRAEGGISSNEMRSLIRAG